MELRTKFFKKYKSKKLVIFVLLFILISLLLTVLFKGYIKYKKYQLLNFEDKEYLLSINSLNTCELNSDCYIYEKSPCGCSSTHSVNKKYKNNKELLENTFPDTKDVESCDAYCMTRPSGFYQVLCKNQRCSYNLVEHFNYMGEYEYIKDGESIPIPQSWNDSITIRELSY